MATKVNFAYIVLSGSIDSLKLPGMCFKLNTWL